MNKYRFSPSALDKFQKLLDAEAYFESDFNNTDAGPKQSLDEIRAEREKELLDHINKVDMAPTEAASRGTALNELVDQFIRWHYTDTPFEEIYDKSGRVNVGNITEHTVECECEGFSFVFARELVEYLAERLQNGTPQLHAEAWLSVDDDSWVLLHGYPDYIMPRQVTDLKTTTSYSFGKYERYWQRYVYPYILKLSGYMQECDMFEFLAVELKADRKTGIIAGSVASEQYTDVSLSKCEEKLRWICSAFIGWIEDHKSQIYEQRIFCK